DTAAIAGLAVALVGLVLADVTGNWMFDAAASIAIGLIVSVVAVILARESRLILTGEAGDPALVEDIRRLATSDPAVGRVGPPLTMRLGPDDLLLNLDIEFCPDITGHEIQDAVQRLEAAIRRAHPEVRRIFLEAARLARAGTAPASP